MAESAFQGESLGHVYAQALINMATQQNVLAEVTEDVRGLIAVLDANPQFAQFAEAATISDEEKIAAIQKIFTGRIHILVVETLKSMARRNRLVFIRGFVAAFEHILLKLSNHVDVELISAQVLSPEAFTRVQEVVGRTLGQTPDFKSSIDAELLGGLKLRVGDTMIDASVQTQLTKIRRQLMQNGISAMQQRLDTLVA